MYETDQLISMIGSKRAMLSQLRLLFSSLDLPTKPIRFLDPFCGSGAVARLARSMGMQVRASDILPFSHTVNSIYLGFNDEDLLPMFQEMGGLDAYLSMLNLQGLYCATTAEALVHPYLSRHYAPLDENSYDHATERLFFHPANARFLDAVRSEIDQSLQDGKLSVVEHSLIVTTILYAASVKANTSGTFTSYHKSLSNRRRISQIMELQAPYLPSKQVPKGKMYLADAAEFLKKNSGDICFLDPPFSVQQYSSAYHLLNTIALWDGYEPPPVSTQKAGIRSDWKQSASRFSSLQHADAAFVQLFGSIDARYIILCYPTKGIVSTKRIMELLSARHGPVNVIPLRKANQGGVQAKGKVAQIEQVFVAGKKAVHYWPVEEALKRVELYKRIDFLVSQVFCEVQEASPFSFAGGIILKTPLDDAKLLSMGTTELENVIGRLEKAVCTSEIQAIRLLCQSLEEPQIESSEAVILKRRLRMSLVQAKEKWGIKQLMHLLEDEPQSAVVKQWMSQYV
ncbi:MAG: DNA adenine methylase [Sphaerochaetaceae bacterium]